MNFNDITSAFCALAATADVSAISDWIKPLERLVILMYDCTSSQESVNQARKELFTQKGQAIDGLPPTLAALVQHTNRAPYQAGHCWGLMMVAAPHQVTGWKLAAGRFSEPYYQKLPRHVANS